MEYVIPVKPSGWPQDSGPSTGGSGGEGSSVSSVSLSLSNNKLTASISDTSGRNVEGSVQGVASTKQANIFDAENTFNEPVVVNSIDDRWGNNVFDVGNNGTDLTVGGPKKALQLASSSDSIRVNGNKNIALTTETTLEDKVGIKTIVNMPMTYIDCPSDFTPEKLYASVANDSYTHCYLNAVSGNEAFPGSRDGFIVIFRRSSDYGHMIFFSHSGRVYARAVAGGVFDDWVALSDNTFYNGA